MCQGVVVVGCVRVVRRGVLLRKKETIGVSPEMGMKVYEAVRVVGVMEGV